MKVTVDAKHGRFTVHDNDRWLGRSIIETGVYSEQEVELLCSLIEADDVVVEVGSNFGSISIPLAKAVGAGGTVHAFEPQPQLNELLIENVAVNGLAMVVCIHNDALTDVPAWMSMAKIDWDKPLLNSGDAELLEPNIDHGDCFRVEARTLDMSRLDRIALLKVDVEGHELKVLKGARSTIERCKPILYVENDRPHLSRDLLAFILNDLGYRAWWHFPDLYNANERIDGGDYVSHNVLCFYRDQKPIGVDGLREVMSEHDSAALAMQRTVEAKTANGFVHRNAPAKRANEWACVVRLGGVGDNLIASSVLPHLKRKWGHVEVIAAEPQHVVFENNPNIDKLTMLPQGYPNWEDGIKWQEHWLARSKEYAFFANLSHT
jgi:FkbM family methyltransferase